MGYMDGSYDTVAPEIRSRLLISFVYTRYPGNTVVQTAPQVVIKYGGTFSEEIKFARFARCKTSLPVPRIIHYPPFTRLVYLYGENPWRLAGQSNRYIDCGSRIASQLKSILAELRSVESSQILESVSGGLYRNEFLPPHVHQTRSIYAFNMFQVSEDAELLVSVQTLPKRISTFQLRFTTRNRNQTLVYGTTKARSCVCKGVCKVGHFSNTIYRNLEQSI